MTNRTPSARAVAFCLLAIAPLSLPLGCNLLGKKSEDAGAAPVVSVVTPTTADPAATQPDPATPATGLATTRPFVPGPRVVLTDAGKPLVVVDAGPAVVDAGAAKSDAAPVPTPTIKPPALPTGLPTTIPTVVPTGLKIPTAIPTTLPTWPPK
jgi:hypothetical protein